MQVLVCAASRHGATVEVAATIGSVLLAEGFDVRILAPEEVTRVDGFGAAIIGSGVYLGRWLDRARALVLHHRDGLSRIPVWLFSSGPVGEEIGHADAADGIRLSGLVAARGHRTFAGLVDRRRLGLGERALVAVGRTPDGDFRPWDDIEAWAHEIAAALRAQDDVAVPVESPR